MVDTISTTTVLMKTILMTTLTISTILTTSIVELTNTIDSIITMDKSRSQRGVRRSRLKEDAAEQDVGIKAHRYDRRLHLI